MNIAHGSFRNNLRMPTGIQTYICALTDTQLCRHMPNTYMLKNTYIYFEREKKKRKKTAHF